MCLPRLSHCCLPLRTSGRNQGIKAFKSVTRGQSGKGRKSNGETRTAMIVVSLALRTGMRGPAVPSACVQARQGRTESRATVEAGRSGTSWPGERRELLDYQTKSAQRR